ncbi:hypothetical protein [Haemophilus parahaemolyticus]|mgnify:CR=1 FL=1|uniref:hypothetical protein n=1 Tax=Haemophilus parahaemolyticus TaxID=735 RepID=UPI0024902F31|nr:hypothetical protein [Haemophilus parahaemolyticus]
MKSITLHSPVVFTFSENEESEREASIKFINDLEIYFLKNFNITIDLSNTVEAYAESTLVLFAQIHSMRYRSASKKQRIEFKIIYPIQELNPNGYAYFVLTGLNKALEAKNEEDIIALTEGRNFYQSGCAARFDDMILSNWETILEEEIDIEQQFLLHQGVSEAILNVRNHAYTNKQSLRNKIGKGRWWQCSWYQRSKRRFVFLIYDMGCGILGSYPESSLDDTKRLTEAMTEGYTRYSNRKRGKGSENIKQVISRAVETESLTVYTDNLIYQYYYKDNNASDTCITSQVQMPIRGTLVAWTLTLLEEQ